MPITLAGRYNRPVGLETVVEIGWRAAEVLAASPVARVLAPMRSSIYIVAAGEILWLGGPAEVKHPRAVLLSEPPDTSAIAAGAWVSVPRWAVRAWRPGVPQCDVQGARALRRGGARLAEIARSLGNPAGFGAWLVKTPLAFPLGGATKAADALARACAADDAAAAADASLTMLGLGAGLTPSGDDFVGGAFFARAALARLLGSEVPAWRRAATTVREAAARSTTPIGVALLGDLLAGDGWAPLHDLAQGLASEDGTATLNAASRLTRLGHSSGWDLLAGFAAGAR
jgi:hypothetical protein